MDVIDKDNIKSMVHVAKCEVEEIHNKTQDTLEFLSMLESEDIDFDAMSKITGFIKTRYEFVSDIFRILENVVVNKPTTECVDKMINVILEHTERTKEFNELINEAVSKISVKH